MSHRLQHTAVPTAAAEDNNDDEDDDDDDYVCKLFAHNAQRSLDEIFSMYSDDIVSTCSLRSVISYMFFG